ncbi:MAG: phage capsid protein, partial [Chloroflexota bacterium]
MSVSPITTAFVQQYGTNVAMLLQQEGSRFRGAVQEYALHGKAAEVLEQFGQVTATKNNARYSDTPLIETPQDRRWCYPNDYDIADLIDNQDRLRLI